MSKKQTDFALSVLIRLSVLQGIGIQMSSVCVCVCVCVCGWLTGFQSMPTVTAQQPQLPDFAHRPGLLA